MAINKKSRTVLSVLSVLFILFTIAAAPAASADSDQPRSGGTFQLFPPAPLLKAYASEQLSTVNRAEFQWVNEAPPGYPWPEDYGSRPLADIRLGVEIPVAGGEWNGGAWYLGLPLSVEFITDLFEAHTAPVVNSDYWFGIRIEGLFHLKNRWPANIGVRVLPVYHESTHLGDETALYMAAEDPTDFYRVNVSYEAWEFTLGIDEWEGKDDSALNLRLGMSGRWNADGWYNLPDNEEMGTNLSTGDFHASRRNMEYFGQVNAVVPRGFPSIGPWVFQAGLELRNTILFDYFSDDPEKRIWTLSSTLGWYRHLQGIRARRIGYYMRLLAGRNPHGQFREQEDYFVFGTGLSVGI